MKAKIIAIFVFMMFVSIQSAIAGKVYIDLKDNVALRDKAITIEDISWVIGSNVELVNKVKGITVGRTPGRNRTKKFDREFLKMKMKQSQIRKSAVVFIGAEVVTVRVESTKILGVELAQTAREYLLSILDTGIKETTVELSRIPSDQWVPVNRNDIKLEAVLIDTNKDRGNVGVMVSATSNGIPFIKRPVFFNVRVYEYVVIARKTINRKRPLSKNDLIIARKETTKLHRSNYTNIEDLIGKTSRRNISSNTIITENMVEATPTIRRGHLVKIYINSNGFRIITKGLAQETGYKGEVIKVRNIDSKKIIYGKVIDSENVKIVF